MFELCLRSSSQVIVSTFINVSNDIINPSITDIREQKKSPMSKSVVYIWLLFCLVENNKAYKSLAVLRIRCVWFGPELNSAESGLQGPELS